MKRVAATVLLLASACCAAECTRDEAYAAESVTDYLDSWHNVYLFYREYRACYDASIAEGAVDKIFSLWADHWDQLPQMLALTAKDAEFDRFLRAQLTDQTVPADVHARVLRNATNACPESARNFCRAVIASHHQAEVP